MPYPFLFVGQGFSTTYKCLEGDIWFEEPPAEGVHSWIAEQIPAPLRFALSFAGLARPVRATHGVRFSGAILHFASDDSLEARVRVLYSRKYAGVDPARAFADLIRARSQDRRFRDHIPTRDEWATFCDAFQRAVLTIHERCRVFLVLLPGNGEYGEELGPWHDWSCEHAHLVASRAAREPWTSARDMSYLAANLLQDVFKKIRLDAVPESQRQVWLSWLDRLIDEGDAAPRDDFVEHVESIITSLPEAEREPAMLRLRPSTVAAVAARRAQRWAAVLLRTGSATEIAEAITSGRLSIETALRTLGSKMRKPPRLDEVVAVCPPLSLIRRGASAELAAALAQRAVTPRDIQACAVVWPDVAEPILATAVSSAPFPDTPGKARTEFLSAVNSLAVRHQRNGDFEAAWAVMAPYVSFGTELPYLCHTAACSLAKRGQLDEALDQLQTAAEHGYPHMRKVALDRDLEALFGHPRFHAIVAKATPPAAAPADNE
jgi:hypothetical protein